MAALRTFLSRFFGDDARAGGLLALCVFAVYLATLSPSIGPEDAGELATAARTLSITHPTGYPLFCLLGRMFSLLPLGDLRVIVKLNLMGAVLCAAAAFVFYRLFLILLRDDALGGTAGKTRPLPRQTTPSQRLAAAAGVLALAFSRVVWINAVLVEVYALHLLFLGLVTLLFVLAVRAKLEGDAREDRLWLLFAYVFGLSFANHMMTVLLMPPFLYLYFSTHGAGKNAWLKIAKGIPSFFLALTAYLYLPVRAMTNPVMNWGNPSLPSSFWQHVSGAQYRDRMFMSVEVARNKFVEFFSQLPGDLGWLPLLPALAGVLLLFRGNRRMAVFSLLVFATSVFYAINYDFEDPNFRLNAHLIVALWGAFGLLALARKIRLPRASRRVVLGTALAATAFSPLLLNYRTMDESGNYSVEDFVRNAFATTEPNGVILSGTFIEFSFAAWYLQYVEGVRPDIAVVDYTLMSLTWHFLQMERARPEHALEARRLMRAGLRASGAPIVVSQRTRASANPEDWDPEHLALVRTFVQTWHRFAPLYIVGMVPDEALGGFFDVPQGIVKRLYDTLPPAEPIRFFSFRPLPARDTRHVHNVRGAYAEAYYNQALYRLVVLGDQPGAERLLSKALEIRPDFQEAQGLLAQVRYGAPAP